MATFDVYYMKPASFARFIIGIETPTLKELGETHTKVKRVAANDPEDVWVNMQAEQWSPNGEARDLILGLGLQHTSMSVGDVCHNVDDNTYHAVAMMGFKKI